MSTTALPATGDDTFPPQNGAPEPDLVIETAEDLFTALRDPDFLTRLAVLREIHADRDAALSFGKYMGWDVLDELIHQGYQSCGVTYYKALLAAIGSFGNDPRAIEFLKKALAMSTRADVVLLAARLLAASDGIEDAVPVLCALLMSQESEMHARAAAHVLVGHLPHPDPHQRVRLALLAPPTRPLVPRLSERDLETTAPWFLELGGTFAVDARIALETLGPPAAAMVLRGWQSLSDESRQWALLWSSQIVPEQAREYIARVLSGSTDPVSVQLAAVESLASLGAKASTLVPLLSRYLLPDTDPVLRLAALRVGATGASWRALLTDPEESRLVQQIAIARLAEEGTSAVPDLLRLLESSFWELRAPASDALAALGKREGRETRTAIVEGARALILHPGDGIRAAAAQTLLALGDDDWLEATFLS